MQQLMEIAAQPKRYIIGLNVKVMTGCIKSKIALLIYLKIV
jgi:hypothetical protein